MSVIGYGSNVRGFPSAPSVGYGLSSKGSGSKGGKGIKSTDDYPGTTRVDVRRRDQGELVVVVVVVEGEAGLVVERRRRRRRRRRVGGLWRASGKSTIFGPRDVQRQGPEKGRRGERRGPAARRDAERRRQRGERGAHGRRGVGPGRDERGDELSDSYTVTLMPTECRREDGVLLRAAHEGRLDDDDGDHRERRLPARVTLARRSHLDRNAALRRGRERLGRPVPPPREHALHLQRLRAERRRDAERPASLVAHATSRRRRAASRGSTTAL